jgi:hypothetical protein
VLLLTALVGFFPSYYSKLGNGSSRTSFMAPSRRCGCGCCAN